MPKKEKTNFKQRVHDIVRLIPEGRVASYGQIAAYLGMPRAAQAVGWMLHVTSEYEEIPCHRVVTKNGRLSRAFAYGGVIRHRRDLEKEGVKVGDDDRVDMKEYCWKPENKEIEFLELEQKDLDYLGDKFF